MKRRLFLPLLWRARMRSAQDHHPCPRTVLRAASGVRTPTGRRGRQFRKWRCGLSCDQGEARRAQARLATAATCRPAKCSVRPCLPVSDPGVPALPQQAHRLSWCCSSERSMTNSSTISSAQPPGHRRSLARAHPAGSLTAGRLGPTGRDISPAERGTLLLAVDTDGLRSGAAPGEMILQSCRPAPSQIRGRQRARAVRDHLEP